VDNEATPVADIPVEAKPVAKAKPAAKEPVPAEPAAEEDDAKPKRRGWWSLGR
jgi:ribonuclease E